MGLASMGGINLAQKAADRLGMSVESLQGFAFKGKVEIEELSDLFFKTSKAIGKGGGEGGEQTRQRSSARSARAPAMQSTPCTASPVRGRSSACRRRS